MRIADKKVGAPHYQMLFCPKGYARRGIRDNSRQFIGGNANDKNDYSFRRGA
jgi:hypothetical protein